MSRHSESRRLPRTHPGPRPRAGPERAPGPVARGAAGGLPALLALLAASLGWAGAEPLRAQTVQVTAERENFRLEPNGQRLATVNRGTTLEVVDARGQWRQVTLTGWIYDPSVTETDRQGFDLVVSADGGENLRVEPGPRARIAARLLEGCLLEELGRRQGWTRVRRTAWMWAPSLGAAGAGGGEDGADEARPGEDRPAGPLTLPDHYVVDGAPARLHVAPEGDTLAVARPGADLQVLDRDGGWARVRLEGWVRTAEIASADSAGPREGLGVAELVANPEKYRGQRVRWTVQFVSLERAEPVRTDFAEDEPFILARRPGSAEGFVYLAVPDQLLPQVEELRPLQSITVVGRVRTGRSAVMGAPVIDLLQLRPGGSS